MHLLHTSVRVHRNNTLEVIPYIYTIFTNFTLDNSQPFRTKIKALEIRNSDSTLRKNERSTVHFGSISQDPNPLSSQAKKKTLLDLSLSPKMDVIKRSKFTFFDFITTMGGLFAFIFPLFTLSAFFNYFHLQEQLVASLVVEHSGDEAFEKTQCKIKACSSAMTLALEKVR